MSDDIKAGDRELADVCADILFRHHGIITSSGLTWARELREAGYRKSHTITTAEELNALPEGSIVRTENYQLYVKDQIKGRDPISWWVTTNEHFYFRTKDIELPATVLYEQEAPL